MIKYPRLNPKTLKELKKLLKEIETAISTIINQGLLTDDESINFLLNSYEELINQKEKLIKELLHGLKNHT